MFVCLPIRHSVVEGFIVLWDCVRPNGWRFKIVGFRYHHPTEQTNGTREHACIRTYVNSGLYRHLPIICIWFWRPLVVNSMQSFINEHAYIYVRNHEQRANMWAQATGKRSSSNEYACIHWPDKYLQSLTKQTGRAPLAAWIHYCILHVSPSYKAGNNESMRMSVYIYIYTEYGTNYYERYNVGLHAKHGHII